MRTGRQHFVWIIVSLILFLPNGVRGQEAQTITCVQCHSGQPERLSQPTREWPQSIHARNGINCAGCHGGDPTAPGMEAMSPERGFLGAPRPEKVPDFCGRCHPGVKQDYLESAHGRALGSGGPQCVTCHGSHAVMLASIELINQTSCTRCHSYERAEQIRTALSATDAQLSQVNARLERLHRQGFDVGGMKGELFDARNRFHRLFHSVDVEKVRAGSGTIRAGLEGIGSRAAQMETRLERRKTVGVVVVGLVLLVSGLLFYIHYSYKR